MRAGKTAVGSDNATERATATRAGPRQLDILLGGDAGGKTAAVLQKLHRFLQTVRHRAVAGSVTCSRAPAHSITRLGEFASL